MELPLLFLVFAWRRQVLLLLPRIFSGLWAQVALPPWPHWTTRSYELSLPPLWLWPSTPSWSFLLKKRLPRFCQTCTLHCLSGSFLSKMPADVKTHWKEMWDRGFHFILQSQPWTSLSLYFCLSSFEERSESYSWAIEACPYGPDDEGRQWLQSVLSLPHGFTSVTMRSKISQRKKAETDEQQRTLTRCSFKN